MRRTFIIGPLPPPLTGQTLSLAMLCEAFGRRGLEYEVINLSPGAAGVVGKVSWHRLKSLIHPMTVGLSLVARQSTNVYMTNAQSWLGFLRDAVFMLSAWAGGHRIVLHLKGGNYDDFYRRQSRLRRFLIRRTLALADNLIVLGEALAGMYTFVPGHEDKVIVVNNGLPEELPDWDSVRASKERDEGVVRILYLSNLIESKGYLTVLEAIRHLVHDRKLNVQANFCGQFRIVSDTTLHRSAEDARADFIRRIELYSLSEHVVWHGNVSGDRKRKLLACSHYFVLPTAYQDEGQPVSIIEAMAYGALVVSTRYRTIPELLDEGRAGVFVESRRPEQIVEAIVSHPVGSAQYRERVEAARRRCAERFSRERHLDRLIAVIANNSRERGPSDGLRPDFHPARETKSSSTTGPALSANCAVDSDLLLRRGLLPGAVPFPIGQLT